MMAVARNNVAIDEHGHALCECGLQATVITSRSIIHPGRDYYRCPKERNDPTLCRLFVWLDEAIMPTLKRNLSTDIEQGSPTKRTRTAQPPTTPTKKAHSNFPSTPASKQKRIEEIKNALMPPTSPTPNHSKSRVERNEQSARDDDVFSSPSPSTSRRREYALPPVKQEVDDEPLLQPNLPTPSSIQRHLLNSADSILNDMDVLKDDVETIWRRKVAAERSRDAKVKKIELLEVRVRELEAENERLKSS
ncbi:hypothetical protein F5146DRAFT_1173922 [Armillaria mellea]|nr:hypothetical protein F5146DRAFT_1173922 [Armillaria mellea]